MKLNEIICLDIDDCDPNPCYPGVACRDEPAPGRGYACGRQYQCSKKNNVIHYKGIFNLKQTFALKCNLE